MKRECPFRAWGTLSWLGGALTRCESGFSGCVNALLGFVIAFSRNELPSKVVEVSFQSV